MLHVNSWRIWLFFSFLFGFYWSSMWKSSKHRHSNELDSRCSIISFMRHTWNRSENKNVHNRPIGWMVGWMIVVVIVAVSWSPVVSGQSICFPNRARALFCFAFFPESKYLRLSIKITLAYDCDGMKQIVANVSNHIYGTAKKRSSTSDCIPMYAWNGADASG